MERNTKSYEIRDRASDKLLWRFHSAFPEKTPRFLLQYTTINRRHLANTMLLNELEEEITPTEEEINRYLNLTSTPKYVRKFLKYS